MSELRIIALLSLTVSFLLSIPSAMAGSCQDEKETERIDTVREEKDLHESRSLSFPVLGVLAGALDALSRLYPSSNSKGENGSTSGIVVIGPETVEVCMPDEE